MLPELRSAGAERGMLRPAVTARMGLASGGPRSSAGDLKESGEGVELVNRPEASETLFKAGADWGLLAVEELTRRDAEDSTCASEMRESCM